MNKSAENLAYEAILEMILSKEFSPGDRLVESEIAERLNLSRTPVRNVMRQLVAEGLLEVKENKGCYIPKLTPQDMYEVFKARAYMEGHASLEAASCRTEADIQLLEEMIHKERAFYSEGKLKEYSEVNNAFHLSIARICKNTYIEKFTRQLFWRSELYIFHFDRFYTPTNPKELLRNPDESISCSQHLQIVNAIVAADGALAEGAMRSHIYTTFSRMSGRNPQTGICVPGFFTKTI
ncbi:GntR family transcriptional regulator [Cloacibacillus evryensis]|uniref:GntR family transcriptional regulator n=1 Tax=Cloacibacillus evryensis TaxID=508460 RepID=UPI0026E08379|nr:GntR family transcriptional regulator [Cloacibacillus evryensis]